MSGDRDKSSGFRRLLYDAMVLSQSLRVVLDCRYYDDLADSEDEDSDLIEPDVEAHHINAMVQIRSMIDFLSCRRSRKGDPMHALHFEGCPKQSINFKLRDACNQYAAHKDWSAVSKNEDSGVKQVKKEELVKLGLVVLKAFERFRKKLQVSDGNGGYRLDITLNDFAKKYESEYKKNFDYLKNQKI